MKIVRVMSYILFAFANAIWGGVSGAQAFVSGFSAQSNPENGIWIVAFHYASFLVHLCLMFIAWGYRKSLSVLSMYLLLLSPIAFYFCWKFVYQFLNSRVADCADCILAWPIF